MLGPDAHLPRTVFTDRGTGMYNPSGKIVRQYEEAIRRAGMRVFWGSDAWQQSPDMPDLLLHETAVAWFRRCMKLEWPVCAPWEETLPQWSQRARRVVEHINTNYDVKPKTVARSLPPPQAAPPKAGHGEMAPPAKRART